MKDFIQIVFSDLQPEQQEILMAHLTEAGYEGFEQADTELNAFIPKQAFDPEILRELSFKYQLTYKQEFIAAKNWNAIWESNFQPVMIDDFVCIRADFHSPAKGVEHEIVITPKMSFGTGHHATTFMMVQQMKEINFNGKTVFDFGTGTGVLAILAEKLKAKEIVAVDNDEWSIANATENIEKNSGTVIRLEKADTITIIRQFDIILANINRNVIIKNFPVMANRLAKDGVLLISGLLKEDENAILHLATEERLLLIKKTIKENWISLRFTH